MDMGVAHTLSRHFFWQENTLWKHEIEGRNVTVTLAESDLIVNTDAVGRYLANDADLMDDQWKCRAWKGKGLDVVWFTQIDHAQVFDRREHRQKLVKVVRAYSRCVNT